MFTLVLLCSAAVLAVYWYFRQCYSVFEKLGIPGPRPVVLFGNVTEFKAKFPLDVFRDWIHTYGKVLGFYEGLRPSVVVSDPRLTQQILVKRFSSFTARPQCTPFLNPTEDLSIQNADGELWRRQRMVVAKAFHTKCLKQIVPAVAAVSQRLLTRLEEVRRSHPDGFDISGLADRFILDAFANAAFDYNSDSINNDDELLLKYMTAYNKSGSAENPLAGFARLFPPLTSILQRFDRDHQRLHAQHLKKMQELIAREKRKLAQNNGGEKAGNLLSRLLSGYSLSVDDDNNDVKYQLSDVEVLAQAASLVGGGLGPSHSILAFALYLLATHPGVQEKLMAEINHHCPKLEELTYENLSRLEYLDMIIEETGRVFPVVPGVARVCTEDCEIDGFRFRKGMMVRVMTVSMYADNDIYPNADQFIPERFSREEREKRPYFSFLTYGHGPRMCVGFKFGILQIKVAIIQLLRHYVLTTSSQTEIPLQTSLRPFLCPKNGVHVRLVSRET